MPSIAVGLDILMISETKLDESFPVSQFLIPAFENPIRLDRSSSEARIIFFLMVNSIQKSVKDNALFLECL